MKIGIITISQDGQHIAKKICRHFEKAVILKWPDNISLEKFVGEIFNTFDGIIFIMSLGIVVRVIASCIKNKHTDPAIVVVDRKARFSISALSGHEGGANKLTISVANIIGAEPVITTASESKKNIIIGLGCRREIKKQEIKQAVNYGLSAINETLKSVRYISTVDVKSDEEGLKQACIEMDIPLRIVSADIIKIFKGKYKKSEIVQKNLGIWGVSEPCAMLTAKNPQLILQKTKVGKVTIAIAKERFQ
jgi:cobalt-precorrin 5A hydrolase